MAKTMREMLKSIKKQLEEYPEALDAPCVSSHSASGAVEGIYGPYVEEAGDDDEELYDTGNVKAGEFYWSFSIDH